MGQEKITTPTFILSLEEVQNQFEAWRSMRKHREPIPDALWEAAASLRKNYSIHQIAKALHLNYNDLKKRVQKLDIVSRPGASSHSAFVELDLSRSIFPTECIVEMEAPEGAKMKVHFKGGVDFDLLGLAKVFLDKKP
jgi:hypothetical protein